MGRYYEKDYKKQMDTSTLILWVCLGIFIGIIIMKLVFLSQKKSIQKDAVKWSRNSIIGELYEKILPALPNFPYAPKDMVFVGKWCDYIIFDWLSEWYLREIVFLELKSGNATLNTNEKMIRDIVDRKKVRYSEYRIGSTKNKE